MSEHESPAGFDGLRIETNGSVTYAPDWPALASLHKKMASVMGQVTTVLQDETHPTQHWKYASYSAVMDVIRIAMSSQNLGLFPHVVKYDQTEQDVNNKPARRSVVEIDFSFVDGDTGAIRTSHWVGEALDFGTADKGLNKACTAAEKYCLMRTFLVSTSDDVEPDATGKSGAEGRRNSPPRAQAGLPNASAIDPESTEPTPSSSHWMENPKTRAKFWAEAERIGLDSKMVHHEWDVESMKDTKADAKASLRLLEIIEYALKRKIGLHGLHQATGILRAVELIGTKKTWGQLKAQIDAYEAPSS